MSLQPSKASRSLSSAGQACRECRRRKGKCDSKLPVCSVCQRYNRHCLYDKHSRSALTRKHLTEVEERLERAEALLKTLLTESELSQIHEQGISLKLEGGPNTPGRLFADVAQSLGPGQSSVHDAAQESAPFGSPTQESQAPSSTSGLQEGVPSAADDDFEWDEREAIWSSHDPRTRSSIFRSNSDNLLPKITDGMATLTANDSNTGFLGSVSGAALLRLISENKGAVRGAGEATESGGHRSDTLTGFLALQPNQDSAQGTWLRAQPIMTRAFVDNLIDAYFAHYHPTFPILHEATFRQQYAHLIDRPKGTWHILANLVAALGSFVSSTCSEDTDMNLFNSVKSQLTIESLEAGSLVLVQAFAMAANYLQKRNRPNSGYNYGGVALRLAISLGLHKEFHGWQTTPLKKEIRRRVWWSLCVLDVGATVTYGRPLNWPQVGVEAALPMNIHEKDLTPSSESCPPQLDETTIYSYISTQSSYHLSTIRIYNRLISSPMPSAADLIAMDDELIEGWRQRLPAYFCDQDLPLATEHLLGHSISRWRFRVMRILMYRPFLLRWAQDGFGPLSSSTLPSSPDLSHSATVEDVATIRCFQAAEECIAVLYRFWTLGTHTRLAAWYVLYFLLQAALIPVHCLRRNPSHTEAPSWLEQVRTSLDIINAMVNINPSAPKCRDIIHRLCGESLGPEFKEENAGKLGAESFPYDMSGTDLDDPNIESWMTEIETAIDGYDMYCDHLTNAAAPGFGGFGDVSIADEENLTATSAGPSGWGTETSTAVRDWDWGLML